LVEWQEVSATQTNKSQWSYNGFGQRVQEISYTNGVAVTTNKFLWAGGTQPVEQRDASGATVLKRYYGQGMQIVSGSDAGTYFYQHDHLGSVRAMTDSTGNLRGVWDYDPFGRVSNNLVTSNAVDSDFKFTGHFYHEKSTLHLTLYRAYDADTGRWISRDPIGENGGINLYGYCLNDPINLWDPLGLDPYAGYANGPSNPSSDINAFKNRGGQGAGSNVFPFNSPSSLNGALQGASDITRLDLHGHGIPGAFFTGDPLARIYLSDLDLLAEMIADGRVDMEKGAGIRLFACNQDSNAQHLSQKLADRGRGDISVTGANGPVYPNSSETRARVDGGKFKTYQGGKLTGSRPSIPYK